MKWVVRLLLGPSKDPTREGTIHHLQLIAVFAWVGLGADGLSSACYGPEEAYVELGEHSHLALPLAAMVALTVTIISASYAKIIARFPAGGGGYVVATTLLGRWPGLICGCALVVDYVLTITISIAAGIGHIFSFLPEEWHSLKLYAAVAVLCLLTILNLRGVKESILVLLPIFCLFLATHAVMIVAALAQGSSALGELVAENFRGPEAGAGELGIYAALALLLRAFSHGAGTFTGIEAVSNSMQILREPRVQTARRTMAYMALSLALTAAGLLVAYALVHAKSSPTQTLNAVLFEQATAGWPGGRVLVVVSLLSAGALLFVAAQAGFIGGPRALATMAQDAWVPRRFAHLSHRLVIQDGVVLMGFAALLFLFFTRGNVKLLVVLYSINVFITFVLSQMGMCRHWVRERRQQRPWRWGLTINGSGCVLSLLILTTMVSFKFGQGGWATLVVTAGFVTVCVLVRRHYRSVSHALMAFDRQMKTAPIPPSTTPARDRDPSAPTAVLLVSGFNGLGIHSLLTLYRLYPGHYRNFVFVSVGVVDYDRFQSEDEILRLREETVVALKRYEPFVRAMSGYFDSRLAVGADVVDELELACRKLKEEYTNLQVFGGQLVLRRETFWTRFLHDRVAYELQRRLHLQGIPMFILPTRL
jgi:amino acid transporter